MDKEKSEVVQGVDKYLEERLKKQQRWYQEKASSNKKRFMRFQTTIIILGALIPLIVLFFPMLSLKQWDAPTSAAISAIIAILAGIDKLTQPQTNWFNYRSNEEMLKKEEWMYRYLAGPYKDLSKSDAEKQLVERVESVISADITRFAQAEYKKEDVESQKNKT